MMKSHRSANGVIAHRLHTALPRSVYLRFGNNAAGRTRWSSSCWRSRVQSCVSDASIYLSARDPASLNAKMRFQSSFMLITVQPLFFASS